MLKKEINIEHTHCDVVVRISCDYLFQNEEYFSKVKELLESQKSEFGEYSWLIFEGDELISCDENSIWYIAMNSKTNDICGVMIAHPKYEYGYVYLSKVITKSLNKNKTLYSKVGTKIMEVIKNEFDKDEKIFGIFLGSVPTAIDFYKKNNFIDLFEKDYDISNDNEFDTVRKNIHGSNLKLNLDVSEQSSHDMIYFTKLFNTSPSTKLKELCFIFALIQGSKYLVKLMLDLNVKINPKWKKIKDENDNSLLGSSFAVYYYSKELKIKDEDFLNLIEEKNYEISVDLLLAYTLNNYLLELDTLYKILQTTEILGENLSIIKILEIYKSKLLSDDDTLYLFVTLYKQKKNLEVSVFLLDLFSDCDAILYDVKDEMEFLKKYKSILVKKCKE
jgi:hypothetical protein